MNQKTILSNASCSGISIHSGKISEIEFKSAPPNSGIYFIHNGEKIAANYKNVSNTLRGTTLNNISTVEHVLSAIYGLQIDNIEIQIKGSEPPALDGSAIQFVEILKSAEIIEQDFKKEKLIIQKAISLKKGQAEIIVEPSPILVIESEIDYPNTFIGRQIASFSEDKDNYEKDIAPARTFGLIKEVDALRKNNLALGASFDNAIAILENGYSTPLRFPNELARHKILDIMGDIALSGKRIFGKIISKKAGHDLNISLVRRIIDGSS